MRVCHNHKTLTAAEEHEHTKPLMANQSPESNRNHKFRRPCLMRPNLERQTQNPIIQPPRVVASNSIQAHLAHPSYPLLSEQEKEREKNLLVRKNPSPRLTRRNCTSHSLYDIEHEHLYNPIKTSHHTPVPSALRLEAANAKSHNSAPESWRT